MGRFIIKEEMYECGDGCCHSRNKYLYYGDKYLGIVYDEDDTLDLVNKVLSSIKSN